MSTTPATTFETKIREFLKHDSAGGILLAVAAFFALVLANSPLYWLYQDFTEIPVTVAIGDFEISKPLLLWINDGLMAIFFMMVGLEIKREILDGQLSSIDQIVLPGIGAIAGIIAPALIYTYFNLQDPIAIDGWAIPSATDIAFALGIFTLFATKAPLSLKLFLLTVAIFDDIGAIIIIAVFYSDNVAPVSLGIAAVGLSILLLFNYLNIRFISAYMVVGTVIWAAVLKSGVHATLAGFLIAWFIPLKLPNRDGKPMLPTLEHALHPWVGFVILPIFAFGNAGVNIIDADADALFSPITLGIALGLFIGKQVGIFGACWLAIKCSVASMPKGASWTQLYGVSLLCGIGFTMSLFIGTLAFEKQGLEYQTSVKIGVLLGSLLSAVVGGILISRSSKGGIPNKDKTTS